MSKNSYVHAFQELGYSMDVNEISTWLNRDFIDPGFQLMIDDKTCDHVLTDQVPDQEDEPEPEEGELNVCPVSNSWQLMCLRSVSCGLNTSLK